MEKEHQRPRKEPSSQETHETANDDQAGHPDHSEREWGGDQDIDTAGMVPGNKATDDDEPTGM